MANQAQIYPTELLPEIWTAAEAEEAAIIDSGGFKWGSEYDGEHIIDVYHHLRETMTRTAAIKETRKIRNNRRWAWTQAAHFVRLD